MSALEVGNDSFSKRGCKVEAMTRGAKTSQPPLARLARSVELLHNAINPFVRHRSRR